MMAAGVVSRVGVIWMLGDGGPGYIKGDALSILYESAIANRVVQHKGAHTPLEDDPG